MVPSPVVASGGPTWTASNLNIPLPGRLLLETFGVFYVLITYVHARNVFCLIIYKQRSE